MKTLVAVLLASALCRAPACSEGSRGEQDSCTSCGEEYLCTGCGEWDECVEREDPCAGLKCGSECDKLLDSVGWPSSCVGAPIPDDCPFCDLSCPALEPGECL